MGRISKYNLAIESRIIEMYANQWSLTAIAKSLGVSRNTLHRWVNKFNLQARLDAARGELMHDVVRSGRMKLARGITVTERTTKRIELDAEGQPIEVTERSKELPPCDKSLTIIAKRYDKEFGDASDTDNTKSLTHDINVNIMTRRELRELNALSNPLGDVLVEASDIREVIKRGEESTPPEKDDDDE